MTLRYTCPAGNPSKSTETPVVFVVDGDPSIREALDVLIRSVGCQPRTAASAEEFLARPRLMAPCCLLVERHLPGLTGLGLQRLLFDRTELPIIFMSEDIDVPATVEAMKRGALEFLTKPLIRDVLLTAIRHAIELSRASLNHLAQIQVLQARYASLTRRQREIMSLIVTGRLNKQVGCELGISEITVKAHRARMMRKMQARSISELVIMSATLRQRTPAMAADVHVPGESVDAYRYLRAIASCGRPSAWSDRGVGLPWPSPSFEPPTVF
jgi:FixJ family two-component response regulator